MRLEPSPHVKSKSQHSVLVGFLVGFLRVPWFPPTGKVDRVGEVKGPTVIGICCSGDPALVGKAK
jgi:hypothetical protein